MGTTAVYYGSSTGNTEEAARRIAATFGGDIPVINITEASSEQMLSYDNLIIGVSTWGTGDVQDDFEDFMGTFETMRFGGKRMALFGLGDQRGYPDMFVDAMGIVGKAARSAGATLVGAVPRDGYTFDSSEALEADLFIGLPLDEDNQADLTGDRIARWVETLKEAFA